jgi:hypothetical protein
MEFDVGRGVFHTTVSGHGVFLGSLSDEFEFATFAVHCCRRISFFSSGFNSLLVLFLPLF